MRTPRFSANTLVALLRDQTVATLPELMAALGTQSRRSALAPLRGRVERLFNAGDCLPSSHAPSAARELRYRGGTIRDFSH